MDKIIVKHNSVIIKNDENEVRYFFENTDQLCDIIFNCLNSCSYYKVYFKKKTDPTEDNPYGIEELSSYYNLDGNDTLRLLTEEVYVKLIRSLLNVFDYHTNTKERKLSLK